ncbi:hypothetical protein QL285_065662 [Trifolium repens]|nr:hypothetical protein QL285_065662 [Trifolium repens]
MGITLTPFHLSLPSIIHTRSSLMPAPYNNSIHHRIRIITSPAKPLDMFFVPSVKSSNVSLFLISMILKLLINSFNREMNATM